MFMSFQAFPVTFLLQIFKHKPLNPFWQYPLKKLQPDKYPEKNQKKDFLPSNFDFSRFHACKLVKHTFNPLFNRCLTQLIARENQSIEVFVSFILIHSGLNKHGAECRNDNWFLFIFREDLSQHRYETVNVNVSQSDHIVAHSTITARACKERTVGERMWIIFHDDELVSREGEINADVRIKNSPNCCIQIFNKTHSFSSAMWSFFSGHWVWRTHFKDVIMVNYSALVKLEFHIVAESFGGSNKW